MKDYVIYLIVLFVILLVVLPIGVIVYKTRDKTDYDLLDDVIKHKYASSDIEEEFDDTSDKRIKGETNVETINNEANVE